MSLIQESKQLEKHISYVDQNSNQSNIIHNNNSINSDEGVPNQKPEKFGLWQNTCDVTKSGFISAENTTATVPSLVSYWNTINLPMKKTRVPFVLNFETISAKAEKVQSPSIFNPTNSNNKNSDLNFQYNNHTLKMVGSQTQLRQQTSKQHHHSLHMQQQAVSTQNQISLRCVPRAITNDASSSKEKVTTQSSSCEECCSSLICNSALSATHLLATQLSTSNCCKDIATSTIEDFDNTQKPNCFPRSNSNISKSLKNDSTNDFFSNLMNSTNATKSSTDTNVNPKEFKDVNDGDSGSLNSMSQSGKLRCARKTI